MFETIVLLLVFCSGLTIGYFYAQFRFKKSVSNLDVLRHGDIVRLNSVERDILLKNEPPKFSVAFEYKFPKGELKIFGGDSGISESQAVDLFNSIKPGQTYYEYNLIQTGSGNEFWAIKEYNGQGETQSPKYLISGFMNGTIKLSNEG